MFLFFIDNNHYNINVYIFFIFSSLIYFESGRISIFW